MIGEASNVEKNYKLPILLHPKDFKWRMRSAHKWKFMIMMWWLKSF